MFSINFNALNCDIGVKAFNTSRAKNALADALKMTKDLDRWVDGGTLLGIYRSNEIIPHDTDVDLAIRLTCDQGMAIPLPNLPIVKTVFWHHLPMQVAFLLNDVIVDYYFYYTDIENESLVNCTSEAMIKIPKQLAGGNFEFMKWENLEIPVPNNVEGYLEWTYGLDWLIPRSSKRRWTEDRPNLSKTSDSSYWSLPFAHQRIVDFSRQSITNRDNAIVERDNAIVERDNAIVERDNAIVERDNAIVERDNAIVERDNAIVERNNAIVERDNAIVERGLILNSRTWRMLSFYRFMKSFRSK